MKEKAEKREPPFLTFDELITLFFCVSQRLAGEIPAYRKVYTRVVVMKEKG